MSPMKKILTQPVIDFAANKTKRSDALPTSFVENGILLNMNLTMDTGATAPTYRDEAPWNLIKQLRIIKDGETIIAIKGEALFFYNFVMRGQNNPFKLETGTSQADAEIRALLMLPFKMQQTGQPQRTYLDSARISNWRLEVDWGDEDILASANAGSDLKGNLEISSLGFLAGGEAFPGSFVDPVILDIERQFPSATKTKIRLNESYLHRALILRVSDESTGHVLSDTKLIDYTIYQVDTVKSSELTFENSAFLTGWERKLTEDYAGGTPTETESEAEGYLFHDFVELGLQDAPDGSGKLEIEVNVEAGTRLNLTQIMLKRQAA